MSVRRASGLALDSIMVRLLARFVQTQLLRECASVVHEPFYALDTNSGRVRGLELGSVLEQPPAWPSPLLLGRQ